MRPEARADTFNPPRDAYSPELCISLHAPQNRGRREGRVAACTRGLTRKKELREARRPQVQAVTTGLPRAMVLRLIRALPGEPSRLPPSPPRSFQLRSDLAPRPWGARTTRFRRPRTSPPGAQTTASLAIRRRILMETFSSAARLARRSIAHGQAALRPLAHDALASTASPAQRVVTFARRPSWRAGMGQADHIFRNFEIKIFFSVGLDRPNQPERTAEFRFFAHAVVTGSSAARPGQARSFCPTGESPGLPGMGFAGRYEPTADLLWI